MVASGGSSSDVGREFARSVACAAGLWRHVAQEGDEPSGDGAGLVGEIENELEVVVDRWTVGQLGFAEVIAALVVVAVGALLSWLGQRVARSIARRSSSSVTRGLVLVVGRLISVGLILLSVAMALEILGFTLGPMLVVILAAIVGVLMIRPVITNLSTGLVLQARTGFQAGDLISTNGERGTVQEINSRTVVLTTSDGREVHIPNTSVLESPIVNHTSTGRARSHLEVMLETSADADAAVERVQSAVQTVDTILESPPADVVIARLVGRHAVVDVLFWHGPQFSAERRARHDVARAVLGALDSGGIELASPIVVAAPPDADWSSSSGVAAPEV